MNECKQWGAGAVGAVGALPGPCSWLGPEAGGDSQNRASMGQPEINLRINKANKA